MLIKLVLPDTTEAKLEVTASLPAAALYASVCDRLSRDHKLPAFAIRYADDEGDFCLVSSPEEMAECVRVHAAATGAADAGSAEPLTLYVTKAEAGAKPDGGDAKRSASPVPVPSPMASPAATPAAAPAVPVPPLPAAGAAAAAAASTAEPAPNALVAALDARRHVAPAVQATAAPAAAPAAVHVGVRCVQCRAEPIVGVRYRCLACAVDLCGACESAPAAHDPQHVLIKCAVPMPDGWNGADLSNRLPAAAAAAAAAAADAKQPAAAKGADAKGKEPKCTCTRVTKGTNTCVCFDVAFVADVTLPDATATVRRGDTVTKTWRLRNPATGAAMPWPRNTRVICVGGEGDVMPSADADTDGDAQFVQCAAKREVDVTVRIRLPAHSAEARAKTYFRLGYTDPINDRSGKPPKRPADAVLFGQRFWLDNAWAPADDKPVAGASVGAAAAPMVTPVIAADAKAAPAAAAKPIAASAGAAGNAKSKGAAAKGAGKSAAAADAAEAAEPLPHPFDKLAQIRGMGFGAKEYSDDVVLHLIGVSARHRAGYNGNWVIEQLLAIELPKK